ncbi:MAG TPA: type II secretion system F family protein, partial [Fimbriiglobus sp.]|nr:type II secretion system F family protein [Fimbriiglobus sp.]
RSSEPLAERADYTGVAMPFSSRVPLPALMQWCRALRHSIDIGLSPVRIFRQQSKSGPAALRPLAAAIAERLEAGESFQEALKPEAHRFPLLFVELIAVGEQTGRLTETFEELEDYFETVISSRKQLAAALVWPGIMYVSSIFVIAIMLAVLGMIAPTPGQALDPLGLGLVGPVGALKFLVAAGVFTAAVLVGFFFVRDNDRLRAKIEGRLLAVPALGGCFRAFALQRFSLALQMTQEAGLRVDRGLNLSFRATANDAYLRQADAASKRARGGTEIATVLASCGGRLFPDEFLGAVHVGEETGKLAEVMQKQAQIYREEAARKLKVLTMLAGMAVYAMVGLMIIVMIFKIAMTAYIGPMQDAMNAADNPEKWLRQGK